MTKDPYRRIARIYDPLIEPLMRVYREIGMRMLPPESGMWVLEVGCGTGSFLNLYSRANCRTVGIDRSPAMVKAAGSKLSGNAVVNTGDASQMPYKDYAFDAVIMSMTLHEMRATIRSAVLKECSRVLKKSGRFLVIEYHPGPYRFPAGIYSKILSYGIEFAAGREHFRNYRNFLAGGGLPGLIAEHRLKIETQKIVSGGNLALYLLGPMGY
jgi:demethylmenaquinone methyltransferase/2-methoxy-6-polyprenyl-1,4-benzoquinol methylase